jgi:hypothetical protein
MVAVVERGLFCLKKSEILCLPYVAVEVNGKMSIEMFGG